MSTTASHQAAGDALRESLTTALNDAMRGVQFAGGRWSPGYGADLAISALLPVVEAAVLAARAAAEAEVKTLTGERDEARADAEKAESEAEELRGTPWPEWAERCLKIVRAHSGYDGYDDAADGVDLPGELEETLNEYEAEAKKQRHEARAKHETDRHKSAVDHHRAKFTELCARVDAAESRVASLTAERDRLKAALTPFAILSFSFDGFSAEPAALVFQGAEFGQFDCAHHSAFEKMIAAARSALKLPEASDAP